MSPAPQVYGDSQPWPLLALFGIAMSWLISVGDALSQLGGRLIPIRVDGKWRVWTDNANQSISGAANMWAERGRFEWVEKVIDGVAQVFGDSDHCAMARYYDLQRAKARCIEEGYTVS
jgi:hypothetical protein